MPTIMPTVTLIPRMQGFPPITLGSNDILLNVLMNKVLLFAALCLIIATEAVNVTSSSHYEKNRQCGPNNLTNPTVGLRFKVWHGKQSERRI